MRALTTALALSAILRAGYVSFAADPCVSFVPDCALWSTRTRSGPSPR